MTLKSLCEQISCNDTNMLREDNPIGSRIMCPEYSLHLEDKKTYPLPKEEHLFALCWNVSPNHRLYGTIKPSAVSFSYSCHFEPGDKTSYTPTSIWNFPTSCPAGSASGFWGTILPLSRGICA